MLSWNQPFILLLYINMAYILLIYVTFIYAAIIYTAFIYTALKLNSHSRKISAFWLIPAASSVCAFHRAYLQYPAFPEVAAVL